jgi:hypothetical protein
MTTEKGSKYWNLFYAALYCAQNRRIRIEEVHKQFELGSEFNEHITKTLMRIP